MSKSRHTEAQMIGALKQLEAGRKAEDVAREVGVSKHTIYVWRAKYCGMDLSQAQEAKQLRDENTKLRKLVADLSLDKEGLQSVIRKNGWNSVECGRAIRVLSVVDAYTRECLALEVDTSFASRRVTRVLDAIVAERGQLQAIRCDNGLELTSRHFLAWCVERQIELEHIQPGQPTQNARVESFHGRLREECLTGVGFRTCSTRGARSRRGRSSTTKSRRAPAQQAGIQNSERVCGVAGSELLHS